MLGIIAILLVSMYLAFIFPVFKKKAQKPELSDKTSLQVKKLWQIAQSSMHDRKPLRAEKALLAILHVDEKNAAAYNRLGIIYAKSQKFDESIECFEIAQSLDENASSLHNVGLIYLETGEYEKAAMAFKQALDLESDSPARYIALSKAEERLGNRKNAIEALESAYKLNHNLNVLRQILKIYKDADDDEGVASTNARIEAHITAVARKKARSKKPGFSRFTHPRRPVRQVATQKTGLNPANQTKKRI